MSSLNVYVMASLKSCTDNEKRGELLLLDIDEYKASKTCNSCLENKLEHITQGSGIKKRKIHQVLVCKNCNIFWNRDVI
ncbi:uncharacterized protein B0P05DRAFT_542862, partial [Gilbertella persicaria]|uniref:uncharacterized protein n=1 Tax=Gilbertella persicaria TaxID=101096 RepID=UPI00221F7013